MISLTSAVKTRAHGWPAGGKLAGLSVSTVLLFVTHSPVILAAVLVGIISLYALAGRAFLRSGVSALRILWPFVVLVGVWHFWTQDYGTGAAIILRMVCAVALANLVTMTTRLSDMIDVVGWLLAPLRRFGLPTRVLELSIALVIRLTPVLIHKGAQLSDAWRARSAKRAGWHIVLPFTLVALDDADQIAEALRARGGLDT